MIAARGDMVFAPGIQKFVIDCNSKIVVDNLFDGHHPQISHASAFRSAALGPAPERVGGYEQIDMSGVMDSGASHDVPSARSPPSRSTTSWSWESTVM